MIRPLPILAIAWLLQSCSCPTSNEARAERAPVVTPGTVTFLLVNQTGSPRYLFFNRFWTENLSVERRVGQSWISVAYEEPLCVQPCPSDGSTPTCGFCSPPTPSPEARVLERIEESWDGAVFEERQGAQEWCFCFRRAPAPLGRYRVGLCVHSELICEASPCQPDQYGHVRGSPVGERACFHTEFDLTTAARTVTLEVR